MSQKEILLEQIAACNGQKNWFVPVKFALQELTAGQASSGSGNSAHTIREIVNHLIFWDERYLNRFKGNPLPEMKGDNTATFENEIVNEPEWGKAVKRLEKVLTDWEIALREADEAKLSSSPYKDGGWSWYMVIANLTLHNAYHIGQIVQIRKEQGTWDADLGVKD